MDRLFTILTAAKVIRFLTVYCVTFNMLVLTAFSVRMWIASYSFMQLEYQLCNIVLVHKE